MDNKGLSNYKRVFNCDKNIKLTRLFFSLILLCCFASCDRRLNEVTVKNSEIEVTKYEISEFTTAHDFIEVRKGSQTITVLEANSYGFADINIKHDTIVIQYLPNVFYKTIDKAFDYKIKLDTTISIDYWQQKVCDREKSLLP